MAAATRTFPKSALMTLAVALHGVTSAAQGAIRYVDASATGANDGSSWTNAFVSLQSALSAAVINDQIWVAAGTYKPAGPAGNRSASFLLKDRVPTYGGFPSGGSAFEARDPEQYLTILSGDLNGNDGPPLSFQNYADNTFRVVNVQTSSSAITFDGFIVEAGNANGSSGTFEDRGAGLSARGGNQRLEISNCIFRLNFANNRGAGLLIETSGSNTKLDIRNCSFIDNAMPVSGGGNGEGAGLYSSGAPILIARSIFASNTANAGSGAYLDATNGGLIVDCVIEDNLARFDGAGMFVTGSSAQHVAFRGCTFQGNTSVPLNSTGRGGGLFVANVRLDILDSKFFHNACRSNGGGIHILPNGSFPSTVVNCDFRGNRSTTSSGGGIYHLAGTNVTHSVINCVFVGNVAATIGGALDWASSSGPRAVINSTFVANSAGAVGGIRIGGTGISIANSILWENTDLGGVTQSAQFNGTPAIDFSCISGWTGALPGIGNHDQDPLFLNAAGPDRVYGTEDDDLRLMSGSPAVDAGNNAAIPTDSSDVNWNANTSERIPVDLAGNIRVQDDAATPDTGAGAPPIVDMGAFEISNSGAIITYTGPQLGDWHDPQHWSNGTVPDVNSAVNLTASVTISNGAAFAASVVLSEGSELVLAGGSLTTGSVTVTWGSTLSLLAAQASLELTSLSVQPGGTFNWNAGTIVLDGGTWPSLNGIQIGCSGAAALVLKNGAMISAPTIQVCANGVLAGRGTLIGPVSNGGRVRLHVPNDRLTVDGNYTQTSSGTLALELNDYIAEPLISVSGSPGQAVLAGTLEVTLTPGAGHHTGDRYSMIVANNVFNNFTTTSFQALPNGASFQHQVISTSATLMAMIAQTGSRLYVSATAPAAGDGQSWAGALKSLAAAFEVALAFPSHVSEIWVAEGVYKPIKRTAVTDPLSARFVMMNGISMYGGFAGNETMLSKRNWLSHPSILSGDRLGDDGPNFTNMSDNVYNVVAAATTSMTNATVIDGFVITGGNAVAPGNFNGGGMLITAGVPTIRNCKFVNNVANGSGGGLFASTSPRVENCVFLSNRITGANAGFGAGARVAGDFPVFRNCWFEDNVARNASTVGGLLSGGTRSTIVNCTFLRNRSEANSEGGGGLAVGPADIVNCSFIGNQCRTFGAGLVVGGSTPSLVANCMFSGNDSGAGYPLTQFQQGAAITIGASAQTKIANCTFASNISAVSTGGAIYTRFASSSAQVCNSIVWGNSNPSGSNQNAQLSGVGPFTINFSHVQGWTGSFGGLNNNGDDPLFVDPDGPDNIVGTLDDNLRLGSSSTGIDAGDNSCVALDVADLDQDGFTAEPTPFDLSGAIRFYDDPSVADTGSGAPPLVDRGAFENGASSGTVVSFIGPTGGSWFVASNWSGGQLPTEMSEVVISDLVVVDQVGAVAKSILINPDGALRVTSGSLTLESILIEGGGALHLADIDANLSVDSLTIGNRAQMVWDAGTILIRIALVSSEAVSFGCGGSATLQFESGATASAPGIQICEYGVLLGNATLNSQVTNLGLIRPGASVGLLTVNGNYQQVAPGTLEIEIMGFNTGEMDRLVVTGSAAVAGKLDVVMIGTVQPLLSVTSVLHANTISGSFDRVAFPVLTSGFALAANYDQHDIHLIAIPPGPRLYVNASQSQAGQGASWATASPSLALAIEAARAAEGSIDEVWVATGTYVPTVRTVANDPRTATIRLMPGLALYGGFVGNESTLEERDVLSNETIISGDVNDDDLPNFGNRSDNLLQVVTAANTGNTAILDGFTIKSGYAHSGPTTQHHHGGGLYSSNNGPLVRHCTFADNSAVNTGGGVYTTGGSITFENCRFVNNAVPYCTDSCNEGHGGGMMNANGGSCILTNCLFQDNFAARGGGLANDANSVTTLNGCEFALNKARLSGAGISNRGNSVIIADACSFHESQQLVAQNLSGGGIHVFTGSAYITSCTFTNNQARSGGGIAIQTASVVSIDACTFEGNTLASNVSIGRHGGGIAIQESSPIISNCLFIGNSAQDDGGGISIRDTFIWNVTQIVACTFEGNSASRGGALSVGTAVAGDIRIEACDFEGNAATVQAGAVRNARASLTFLDCTMEQNASPGNISLWNEDYGIIRGSVACLGADEVHSTATVSPGESTLGASIGSISASALRLLDRGPGFNDNPQLVIDIAGLQAGTEFDVVNGGKGSVDLTGGLFVRIAEGLQLRAGDQFNVVNAQQLTGSFGVSHFTQVPPGLLMTTQYDRSGVTLVVESIASQISLADPAITAIGGVPVAAEVGDLDNDSDLDLIVCVAAETPGGKGRLYILRNQGNDTQGVWNGFIALAPIEVAASPVGMAVGHFDGDTYLDIAVATQIGNAIWKFRNNGLGDATFSAPLGSTMSAPRAIAAGKFFNAQDDIVVALTNGQIIVQSFDASGAFLASQHVMTSGNLPSRLAVCDIEMDGDNDVVVMNYSDATLAVHRFNVHNLSFDDPSFYSTEIGAIEMILTDFNGDGRIDAIASDSVGNTSIFINQADSSGALFNAIKVPIAPNISSMAALDIEPDGDQDLLAVWEGSSMAGVRLARNDQNGGPTVTFSEFSDLITDGQAALIRAADLNGDQIKDVIAIARGVSELHIGMPAKVQVHIHQQQSSCPADINGDTHVGVPDLLAIISSWGLCSAACPADIAPPGGDGNVGVPDLLSVISSWGTCP